MKVVSFFSGAGGMDLGFILAGHEIIWSNDFDKYAVETYDYNIGNNHNHKSFHGDITEYLSGNKDSIDKALPDCDVIIGGFPCQGFSIANVNRNMEDDRNFLYLELLKAISVKNPKYFVLENVKGLENMEKGKVLEMILDDLEKAGTVESPIFESTNPGYTVSYNVLNALDYGVPQNRERVIILGVRNDLADNLLENHYKSPKNLLDYRKTLNVKTTHSSESDMADPFTPIEKVNFLFDKWLNKTLDPQQNYFIDTPLIYSRSTLSETIKGLPHEFENDESEFLNHVGSMCKVKISNRVGNRATTWDRHAPTIMGRGSGTGGPLIPPHPEQHRRFSVREVARIQTFPDKFHFKGPNSAAYRQIGNAVPVLMAYNIAKILPI
jgi:DNA (cytosine-5)-methyltransferase 1